MMKSIHFVLIGLIFSVGINCVQFYKIAHSATQSKKLNETEIIEISKLFAESQITNDDLNQARQYGKADGKAEAIMLMSNKNNNMNTSQIEKIIAIAEQSKRNELESNSSFLSLLSQASFHKGLHSGKEEIGTSIKKLEAQK